MKLVSNNIAKSYLLLITLPGIYNSQILLLSNLPADVQINWYMSIYICECASARALLDAIILHLTPDQTFANVACKNEI